jgi:hypothetical protein
MTAIGIADVGAERCNFHVEIAAWNYNDTEFCADSEAAGKKFLDARWNGVSGNIVIRRNAAEQFIAHTSADQKSLMAAGAKLLANLNCELARIERWFHCWIIRPLGRMRQAALCEVFRGES